MDKYKLARMFLNQARQEEMLQEKSDEEIADLLLEEVWADIDITSHQSVLVAVVIERLRCRQR